MWLLKTSVVNVKMQFGDFRCLYLPGLSFLVCNNVILFYPGVPAWSFPAQQGQGHHLPTPLCAPQLRHFLAQIKSAWMLWHQRFVSCNRSDQGRDFLCKPPLIMKSPIPEIHCEHHKDAAAVLALGSLRNWVTFADKFSHVCVLYLPKHQPQGRLLNIPSNVLDLVST